MAVSNPNRGYVQFSLRTAFILMTLSAATLGVLFAAPSDEPIVILLLVLMPFPMVFTIAAAYSRGYRRTFAIGAAFPAFLMLIGPLTAQVLYYGLDEAVELVDDDSVMIRLVVLLYAVGAVFLFVAHGALAALVRWLVEQRQEPGLDPEHEVRQVESPFEVETAAE